MASSGQWPDVATSLSKLSLDGDKKSTSAASTTKTAKAKTKKPVVDSWEDEDLSSSEDEEEDNKPQDDGSKAPPPTPISPTHSPASHNFSPYGNTDPTSAPMPGGGGGNSGGPRRPEKTDAVARRMIASALGVKVPKQTDEQKAYDKAVREKERKRRDEEKAAEKRKQEETERAKAAIWED